jgi:hypothetical protein
MHEIYPEAVLIRPIISENIFVDEKSYLPLIDISSFGIE